MVVRPSSLILKMKWSKVFTILGVIGNICIIQPGSGRVLPMWQGNTTNLTYYQVMLQGNTTNFLELYCEI